MRILPITFKNQNFTKKAYNKAELEKGKATSISSGEPYSGVINTKNSNGRIFLYYNNGLLTDSMFYRPARIQSSEGDEEKVVKKYVRNSDNSIIEITTNRYNPWCPAVEKSERHTVQTLYPNGKLKRNETTQNGELDIKTFYKNGQLESSIHTFSNEESIGLKHAYFYDSKGNLIKKIIPYRDKSGRNVVQNEYRNGKIFKSTKAYFTTAKTPKTKMPVDNVGQLVPFEVSEFNKKGELTKKYSI